MRISDWSSDVCSSDLPPPATTGAATRRADHDAAPDRGSCRRSRTPPPKDRRTCRARSVPTASRPAPGADRPQTATRPRGPAPASSRPGRGTRDCHTGNHPRRACRGHRSEEHTSELQSLMRTSYAVFCLKKKNTNTPPKTPTPLTYTHTSPHHHTHHNHPYTHK